MGRKESNETNKQTKTKKLVFLYFCSNPNKSLASKGVFAIFCPCSNLSPKKGVFSFIAFILTKALPKRCFLYFCPYSNQSLATKGGFLYFCPYSNQSQATNGVWLYFCPYSYQSPARKEFFLIIFALVLTKALPKRVFSL